MELFPIIGAGPSQVIRVFADRTRWTPDDALAFVGDLPLEPFRPGTPDTPVMVSVTFTWWRRRAEQIAESWRTHYRNVRVGGPAYDDPGGEFVPGMFLKHGCTITTRGCPKKCGWCKVPFSEGPLRLMKSIPAGWIVQDNNLLATPEAHFAAVFEMLRGQKRAAYFNGGLDKHFLKPWHVPFFDSVPTGELWWACDVPDDFRWLIRVRELFAHVPLRKMRCYTMIGYEGESLADAEKRIERVFELGFMPFSQLYQPPTGDRPTKLYGADWKAVNRKWSRPAAYMGRRDANLDGERQGEPEITGCYSVRPTGIGNAANANTEGPPIQDAARHRGFSEQEQTRAMCDWLTAWQRWLTEQRSAATGSATPNPPAASTDREARPAKRRVRRSRRFRSNSPAI